MASVGLIRNPYSGRGAGKRKWPEIEETLRAALDGGPLRVEETESAGSARIQARRMSDEGCSIVVAAGGDGTVCDVMQGVLGTSAALAILPLGTGNDFARTLGFGTNIEAAISAISAGRTQRIDVARWQLGDREGHFLNVAGCGFDAVVAERVNSGYRMLRGTSAYLAAVFQSLFRYRPTTMRLLVDGEAITQRAMLCAIANAQSYGGGMRVAPTAELQDGLLDLVLVGEFGRLEFLRNFPKVMKGTHLSHAKVLHRQFRRLEISSDPTVPFLVDGELLPPGKLVVEVVPAALDVVVP